LPEQQVKRISVEQGKPGQILAEKVTKHDGVLLASAGAEVTEGLLRMLERLNIDSIVIEESEKRTEEEIKAVHQETLARLERAFRKVGGQPILMALKKTIAFLSKEEMEKSIFALRETQERPSPEEASGEGAEDPPSPSSSASSASSSSSSREEPKDADPPKDRPPARPRQGKANKGG
jgi:hypothetical protein